MARLLIVSRSMALAMRLADQHEVVEHSTDDLDNLIDHLDADVLVLDVGDPVLAVNTVNSLREADQIIPVLLVSGYQPEWEQVEAQQVDGVHVVPLPITRMALLQGVAELTGEDSTINVVKSDDAETPAAGVAAAAPAGPEVKPEAEVKAEAEVDEPAAGEPAKAPANPPSWGIPPRTSEVPAVTASEEVEGVSYSTSITRPFDQEPRTGSFQMLTGDAQNPAGPPRWTRPVLGGRNTPEAPPPANGNAVARRMQRLGNRPRKLQRRSGPEVTEPRIPAGRGLVTDPLGPRTDPYGFPSTDLDRRLDADAAAFVTRGGGAENGFSLPTAELVRLLRERSGDLYSVSDTAQVLADDVIERSDADAAAILVPDGPVWRVSGGVGLRPLERRLELQDSHWLITEIGSAGRAVLIEDTDIIRQELSGAPLAAWRHLLAVPVPDVRGIVVLARGKEAGPFTDRDLSAVIAPVREAAALLAQAVEIRRLARTLSPLRENPDT